MIIHDYRLYGAQPLNVRQPTTIEELSAAVRQAYTDDAAVVPWGSGTRQHIGAAPTRYDVALVTTGMSRILEHTPADLVVTVEAGASLGAVQDVLAQHGQWLPWNPPAPPHATIGGLLATAACGPLRLGYGTPRDWTLGMRAVLGDGRIVKSGSKVVKNVAGYDAHKLHLGALGTLGVIGEVTFKLAPIPAVQRSLIVAVPDLATALAAMERARTAPLAPVSLLALNNVMAQRYVPLVAERFPQEHLLVAARYAGVGAAVERQSVAAMERCAAWDTVVYDGDEDLALWHGLAQVGVGGDGNVLLRAGARPGSLAELAAALSGPATQRGWQKAFALYGGVGLAYAQWLAGDEHHEIAPALAEARSALPAGGYVVVEDAPDAVRSTLDLWGSPPDGIALMRALKAQWNPRDAINVGRYLV